MTHRLVQTSSQMMWWWIFTTQFRSWSFVKPLYLAQSCISEHWKLVWSDKSVNIVFIVTPWRPVKIFHDPGFDKQRLRLSLSQQPLTDGCRSPSLSLSLLSPSYLYLSVLMTKPLSVRSLAKQRGSGLFIKHLYHVQRQHTHTHSAISAALAVEYSRLSLSP